MFSKFERILEASKDGIGALDNEGRQTFLKVSLFQQKLLSRCQALSLNTNNEQLLESDRHAPFENHAPDRLSVF